MAFLKRRNVIYPGNPVICFSARVEVRLWCFSFIRFSFLSFRHIQSKRINASRNSSQPFSNSVSFTSLAPGYFILLILFFFFPQLSVSLVFLSLFHPWQTFSNFLEHFLFLNRHTRSSWISVSFNSIFVTSFSSSLFSSFVSSSNAVYWCVTRLY